MNKTCKVVMLPTNETAMDDLGLLLHKSGKLFIGNRHSCKGTKLYNTLAISESSNGKVAPCDEKDCMPQHLFILSDETIQKGDWCINDNYDTLYQMDGIGATDNWNKVIATTDSSLFQSNGYDMKLPFAYKIPQKFIEEYIEEYNKGNVISSVEVKYSDDFICSDGHTMSYKTACVYPHCDKPNHNYLKLTDNFISIKSTKQSWSREEVVTLCMKMQYETTVYKNSCHYGPNLRELAEWTNKWLEENL